MRRAGLAQPTGARYNHLVTSASKPNVRWTKDTAGAILAATTGFFFANPPALEMTTQLIPRHAHTVAVLVSFAVAVLAYSVGLRAMRKLP